MDEDGPAHKKKFTVKLVLCEGEEYEGSGASIKKAQQAAAEVAMTQSKLPRPPTKSKKQRKDASNPTMLLNHVANQLGITVYYEDEIQSTQMKKFVFDLLLLYYRITSFSGRFPLLPPQRQMRGSPEVRNHLPFMPPPPFPLLRMPHFPPHGFYPPPPYSSPTTRCHLPPPHFAMMPPPLSPLPPHNSGPMQSPQPPRSLLSSDLMAPPPHQMSMNGVRLGSNFKTKVRLSDGSEHVGEGPTKFDSRCNAATNALTHLKPELTELEAKMTKLKLKSSESSSSSNSGDSSTTSSIIDDNKENDTIIDGTGVPEVGDEIEEVRRNRQKSVVSQIHEYALRLKMNVEFEVLQETGEPHKRKYILRCQLSASGKDSIIADGEGTSKKAAKQEACKKMLEKLQGIGRFRFESVVVLLGCF